MVLFKLMWGIVATSVKLRERSGLRNVRTTVGMSSVSFAALTFVIEADSVEEKTTLYGTVFGCIQAFLCQMIELNHQFRLIFDSAVSNTEDIERLFEFLPALNTGMTRGGTEIRRSFCGSYPSKRTFFLRD